MNSLACQIIQPNKQVTQEWTAQVFNRLDVSNPTKKDYSYRAKLFLDFVGDRGFNHNSFLDYKWHLASQTDIGVSTKNKYLIAAKVLLKELNRQGLLQADITQNIRVFKQSKKHKQNGLTETEIQLIMQRVNQLPTNVKNSRLRAILSLLTLQGLRQVEIMRLNFQDIDFANKQAFIKGKGQDDKELIDLHPETVKSLTEYVKTNKIADGALFISFSNNSQRKRLTTRGLRQITKKLLFCLGIKKSVHGFRHYFTTKLIRSYKGDLLEVARYTRHKSLEMLQIYNDNIKRQSDLPRYYQVFDGIVFRKRSFCRT